MDELREKLLNMIDYTCNETFNTTNGLKSLKINDDVVDIEMYIADIENKEAQQETKNAIVRLVKLTLGYKGIKLKFIPSKLKNTIYDNNCKFLLIASGKGGVGKSNVCANLGYALTRLGKKVGIVDADIYGASIPNVLGLPRIEARGDENGNLIPFMEYNMELVSTEFFVEENRPLMWRGPMLQSMLDHFFNKTNWDPNLDYLLVDLPPGTGDVAIDLGQMLPQAKMIVVTTPHKSASYVATKAGLGAREMKLEVLGVVENMSYFINPVNNAKEEIFGAGGGKIVASNLDVDLLAQIPIGQAKNNLFESDEVIGKVYDELASKVDKLLN
ncbi:MAG: Mrp/NBP35 family ATP-binding protein [bacterium]|nr:Mrp/NBP35 family ATP-binding protein [bacterium]